MTKVILNQILQNSIQQRVKEFALIPADRKEMLDLLTGFVRNNKQAGVISRLNFICTHNSRRSQIAQLWAQASAYYYNIDNVECYSGGTEVTAFNTRAVKAIGEAGFDIVEAKPGVNPVYEARYTTGTISVTLFSKKYDDPFNGTNDFAAIMTCSHADENCPFISGASTRIPIAFDDPKTFDDTPQEVEAYRERVNQIGREILYAFSGI